MSVFKVLDERNSYWIKMIIFIFIGALRHKILFPKTSNPTFMAIVAISQRNSKLLKVLLRMLPDNTISIQQ